MGVLLGVWGVSWRGGECEISLLFSTCRASVEVLGGVWGRGCRGEVEHVKFLCYSLHSVLVWASWWERVAWECRERVRIRCFLLQIVPMGSLVGVGCTCV